MHRDNPNAYIKGEHVTGKSGVVVSMMRELPVTLYGGDLFDISCTPIVPKKQEHLAAIWAFCSRSPTVFAIARRCAKICCGLLLDTSAVVAMEILSSGALTSLTS